MKIRQNCLAARIRSQIFILLRKERLTTDVAALDTEKDLPGTAAHLCQQDNMQV
jgi:hypothetical protein